MRTTYNKKSAFDMEPAQRCYAWSQGSPQYDPWFDDYRPSRRPTPQNSVSLSNRTLTTAALATVGAGLALACSRFTSPGRALSRPVRPW